MDIRIFPSKLCGEIDIVSSKSYAHRAIIAASLCDGESVIRNVELSDDIKATLFAIKGIGAKYKLEGKTVTVLKTGIIPDIADIDCNESGSTIRFLIPIVSALGISGTFTGHGRLPKRPLHTLYNLLTEHGVNCEYNGRLPFETNGQLNGGKFYIEGNISSQFITGLMFALPLLSCDSEIILTTKLESASYVELTIDVLKKFGIEIIKTTTGYYIKGNQKYKACDITVEGDWSNAAFFIAANFLGANVKINGLNIDSKQGDRAGEKLIKDFSFYFSKPSEEINIDASDIPDLVPILATVASFSNNHTTICNAARLKLKESDRLKTISDGLIKIAADIKVTDDGLIIKGKKSLKGGVKVQSYNDHRIAMSMAVAALFCENPVEIIGAECVNKSYPGFFSEIKKLGGAFDVITMGR